jgi:hypothetical protein
MLFAEKYPNAIGTELYEHGNIAHVKKADNCYMCGKMTHFIDVHTKARICSEECEIEFYNEMFKNAKRKD